MNAVFFKLKGEFEAEENYTGKRVMAEILQTIRVSDYFSKRMLTRAMEC